MKTTYAVATGDHWEFSIVTENEEQFATQFGTKVEALEYLVNRLVGERAKLQTALTKARRMLARETRKEREAQLVEKIADVLYEHRKAQFKKDFAHLIKEDEG